MAIPEAYPPGHFYSCIPNVDPASLVMDGARTPIFEALDYNDESHLQILGELASYLGDYDSLFSEIIDLKDRGATLTKSYEQLKYSLVNGAFEWMDGRLLHYFLQKHQPKRVIEIGSGNSTLLMHNTIKHFGMATEIICIEPFPSKFLEVLHELGHITLIKKPLQDVDSDLFRTLRENDILFIDSSHVAKLGSDVVHYYTKIFPILSPKVLVHIHDIFSPFDYPVPWTLQGTFWNEQYMLFAFLLNNEKFRIKFCNSYSEFRFSKFLKEIQKDTFEITHGLSTGVFSGGSIWLQVDR